MEALQIPPVALLYIAHQFLYKAYGRSKGHMQTKCLHTEGKFAAKVTMVHKDHRYSGSFDKGQPQNKGNT